MSRSEQRRWLHVLKVVLELLLAAIASYSGASAATL